MWGKEVGKVIEKARVVPTYGIRERSENTSGQ